MEILVFQIIVLIFSVMIHEISHGYTAERLGDPTARMAGRLTLNPIKHLDLVGSVLLPLFLALAHQPVIGWAKPVPYNPYNLREPQKGGGIIALAGPLSNILVAFIFGIFIRVLPFIGFMPSNSVVMLTDLLSTIVLINIALGLFNMLPIPPIDGSKIIVLLLPHRTRLEWEAFWARVARLVMENLLIFFIILFLAWPYLPNIIFSIIGPPLYILFKLFTGL